MFTTSFCLSRNLHEIICTQLCETYIFFEDPFSAVMGYQSRETKSKKEFKRIKLGHFRKKVRKTVSKRILDSKNDVD